MKRNDPEMSEEYDLRGGERGRHADAYARGTNLVLIDPDLHDEFPTREAVNDALREVSRQRRQATPATR